jgi:hypothetical protein
MEKKDDELMTQTNKVRSDGNIIPPLSITHFLSFEGNNNKS